MKMENCKCERIVNEMVESTATMMMMKKRKLDFEELEEKKKLQQQSSSLNYDELVDKFSSRVKDSSSVSNTDDGDLMRLRCCSADRVFVSNCGTDEARCCQIVSDCSRSVDFEVKSFETENSTSPNNKFSRETTPVSEICETTTELMDTLAKKSKVNTTLRKSNSPAVTMPSTAEIDDFFSKAEKYDQNRFAEKCVFVFRCTCCCRYNYDVVKDLPLDGRYEWIRFKP